MAKKSTTQVATESTAIATSTTEATTLASTTTESTALATTNSELTTTATVEVTQPPMVMVVASKSQIANKIFAECYAMSPVPQRKDILARVKKEAGLTDAGAATYLQNYKAKNGLTKAK